MKNLHFLIPYFRTIKNVITRGEEDQICIQFAQWLKSETIEGHIVCPWTHIVNQVADHNVRYGIKYRAMGKNTGVSDYIFAGNGKSLWLEIKASKGTQQESQKIFQRWCEETNTSYKISRSLEEAKEILKDEGVWNKK